MELVVIGIVALRFCINSKICLFIHSFIPQIITDHLPATLGWMLNIQRKNTTTTLKRLPAQ